MKMHLTLFVLSALASSVLGRGKAIGFYILGANRKVLRNSMEQRIRHAVNLAQEKHSEDPHIYFVSGWGCCQCPDKDPKSNRCVSKFCNGEKEFCQTEAQYMNDRILQLYQDWPSERQPQVEMDHEAKFSVMNFLKTIPMINKNCEKLEMVYMITSDYHIRRSQAILDKFANAGLCKVEVRAEGAPHPGFDMDGWLEQVDDVGFKRASVQPYVQVKDGFDTWLLSDCNGRPRLKDILDTTRDRINAEIFAKLSHYLIDARTKGYPKLKRGATQLKARYLKRLIKDIASAEASAGAGAGADKRVTCTGSLVEQYLINNKVQCCSNPRKSEVDEMCTNCDKDFIQANAEERAKKVEDLRKLCGEFADTF